MEELYDIHKWCVRQSILYGEMLEGFKILKAKDQLRVTIYLNNKAKCFIHLIDDYNYMVTDLEVMINKTAYDTINEQFSIFLSDINN